MPCQIGGSDLTNDECGYFRAFTASDGAAGSGRA